MKSARRNLTIGTAFLISANVFCANFAYADEVILGDLVVDGSLCVGLDCMEGEVFGFDTIRLKENNLRQMFQDTSSAANFPTNDWQIKTNDSENGGANYFSIMDCGPDYVPPNDELSLSPLCGDNRYEVDPNSPDPLNPDLILTVPRAGNSVFTIEAGAPEGAFVISADGTILVEGEPIGGGPALDEALARIDDLELIVMDLIEQIEGLGKKSKKPKK